MSSSKKIYKVQESIGNHYSYSFLPSCEWEILLVLTVILFVFSENHTKGYSKYQSKNNAFQKDNRIKLNNESSEMYKDQSVENYTTEYGKYHNENNTPKKDSRIKSNIKSSEMYKVQSSENYTKGYGKYQNKNNTPQKDSRIKPNTESSEMYKAQSREDHIKEYGKYQNESGKKKYSTIKSDIVPNETGKIIAEDFHKKKDFTSVVSPSINRVKKVMESNDSQQHCTMNDKKNDKEISPISLPVANNSNKEEISITNYFVENNILPLNDSNLLNINTEEDDSNPLTSLGAMLKKDYRGVMVCAIMPNGTTICGEVAFNFNDIVALKYNNTTIFINENNIISFY